MNENESFHYIVLLCYVVGMFGVDGNRIDGCRLYCHVFVGGGAVMTAQYYDWGEGGSAFLYHSMMFSALLLVLVHGIWCVTTLN